MIRRRTPPIPPLAALVLSGALLLTGCAAPASSATPGAPAAADAASGHHTTADAPSEAARMICSPEIRESIAAALGIDETPEPTDTFTNGVYTCTYPLAEGDLVLSVMEMDDAAAAEAHTAELLGSFDSAEEITGLENLGLPAFRTDDGVVVFAKDDAMLQVDARNTSPASLSPSALAYRIATNVLACWKAHH
ncbi:hypothetical protein [Planctomonas psychrotolerans]|uniref:hypothetical protein n=1 Tax=Planctomonas psychrotolerans TaxID=2528712 RepID=UPI00123C0AD3|nr:hypothetical protein [Planctomonas psychrotolerans]